MQHLSIIPHNGEQNPNSTGKIDQLGPAGLLREDYGRSNTEGIDSHAVGDAIGSIKQELASINIDVQSLLLSSTNCNASIAALLGPHLEKIIQDTLIQNGQSQRGATQQFYPEQACSGFIQNQNTQQSRTDDECREDRETADDTRFALSPIDRLEVARSKQVTTFSQGSWLGTITISRKTRVQKYWNPDLSQFQIQYQGSETSVNVRLAPWLLKFGLDLSISELFTLHGTPKLSFALEPVRYIDIPSAVWDAATSGHLSTLQQLLSQGAISLKDKCCKTNDNLLEMSLTGLQMNWFWSEMSDNPHSNIEGHLQVSRWLLSQGLQTDMQSDNSALTDFMYLGVDKEIGDYEANVYNMERVLIESSASAPSLPRAKHLILFALTNARCSKSLETLIVDLVHEALIDEVSPELPELPEAFWEEESQITIGMETVVLNSMISLFQSNNDGKNEVERHDSRLTALNGPRRFLTSILLYLKSRNEKPGDEHDAIKLLSTHLTVCRHIKILDDGFDNHMLAFCCRHGLLPTWFKILRAAGYDTDIYEAKHKASHQHSQVTKEWMSAELSTDEVPNSYDSGSKGAPTTPSTNRGNENAYTDGGGDDGDDSSVLHTQGTDIQYWEEFEVAHQCYTSIAPTTHSHPTEIVPPPHTNLLSRVALEGISLLSAIV